MCLKPAMLGSPANAPWFGAAVTDHAWRDWKEEECVMAKDHSADLMQALIAKLYAEITGNDGNIKLPRNKFVTWMRPGIPFAPADLLFCAKGLIGSSAEQTLDLYHQAWTSISSPARRTPSARCTATC
jgi:hypothetical protein